MEMSVDDIGLLAKSHSQGLGREHGVEVELVARGANLDALTPGNIQTAFDLDPRDIVSSVVGANGERVAELLEGADLFQNADVTAVIGEEGRRRDCQDIIRHSPFLTEWRATGYGEPCGRISDDSARVARRRAGRICTSNTIINVILQYPKSECNPWGPTASSHSVLPPSVHRCHPSPVESFLTLERMAIREVPLASVIGTWE